MRHRWFGVALCAAATIIISSATAKTVPTKSPQDEKYAKEFREVWTGLLGHLKTGELQIKEIPPELAECVLREPPRVQIEDRVDGNSGEGMGEGKENLVRITRGFWIDVRRSSILRAGFVLRRLCELLRLHDTLGAVSNTALGRLYEIYGNDQLAPINRATARPGSFEKGALRELSIGPNGKLMGTPVTEIHPFHVYQHYSEVYQMLMTGVALPPGDCEVDSLTLAFVDRVSIQPLFQNSYLTLTKDKNPNEQSRFARLDWWPQGVGTSLPAAFFGATGKDAKAKYQLQIILPKDENSNKSYEWVKLDPQKSESLPTVISAFSINQIDQDLKTWMNTDEGWFEIPHIILDDKNGSVPDREAFVNQKIKDPYQRFRPNRLYRIFQHMEGEAVWIGYATFTDEEGRLRMWQVGVGSVLPGSFFGYADNNGGKQMFQAQFVPVPETLRNGQSDKFPYWLVWKRADYNTPAILINAISGGYRQQDPATGHWFTGRYNAEDRVRLWKKYVGSKPTEIWNPDLATLDPSINEIDRIHAERLREELALVSEKLAAAAETAPANQELQHLRREREVLERKLHFLEFEKTLGFPKLKHPFVQPPAPPPFDWRAYFGS